MVPPVAARRIPDSAPRSVRAGKGEITRAQILATAVEQASAQGFESLTIGLLAERTGLSKSGLFAHFGSKADLQMAVLDEAARQFTEEVFLPALKAPRGLKRLRALFENWIAWPTRAKLSGGCPIHVASREYRHTPGPMHDAVTEREKGLARELRRAVSLAIETGELAPRTDPEQFAFEMFGLILVVFQSEAIAGTEEAHRRGRVAFERLVKNHTA
jgi:AcrR family transcriptional regulator